jgi:hypothetical protein
MTVQNAHHEYYSSALFLILPLIHEISSGTFRYRHAELLRCSKRHMFTYPLTIRIRLQISAMVQLCKWNSHVDRETVLLLLERQWKSTAGEPQLNE